MLNILLLILIAPFLPVFMYGSLSSGANQPTTNKTSQVLGASQQKQEISTGEKKQAQPFSTHNFLSFDTASHSGFMPIRKDNYSDIKIWARSSVVIDVDSGTLLHYDNGRKRTQIASLTKLMTATLTLEKVKNLNETVTISKRALQVDGTVVGCPTSIFCNDERLHVGEKISVRSLLTAMLLDSANDAATQLGIYMAGTPEKFVKMMNAKARSLGLQDTHFCTPSGLEIDGHASECYSSAYDIARIAANSLKYKLIWQIMRTKKAQVSSLDHKYVHNLKNTDKLLSQMPNCIGGKTGFTPLAGHSLLLGAIDKTKKHRIIAVILNDPNRWTDMKKLISWTFANYRWQ